MAASSKLDIRAKPEDALSAAATSGDARRGSNVMWWSLLAAFVVIVGLAIVGAALRNDDRGIRGPGDQAAPDAPRSEKVRPSAVR